MRTLRWSWPVLALALVVLVPWGCYRLRPERRIGLAVLDKTVPFRNWLEHRSLYWLLAHRNVVKSDGTPYDLERDYLGAYPPPVAGDPPARTQDLDAAAVAGQALVYLADTYGVHREDLVSRDEMKAALAAFASASSASSPALRSPMRRTISGSPWIAYSAFS